MSKLRVGSTTDFSGSFLFDIDTVIFTGRADARFDGDQVNGIQLSDTLHVRGSSPLNRIVIDSDIQGVDVSGWSFTDWQARDRVVILGSQWSEELTGSVRNDRLYGNAGDDEIRALAGDDRVEGGRGGDMMRGGSGHDTLSYRNSGGGVAVNLATGRADGGDAAGDDFNGFEDLVGSVFGDWLVGSAGDNRLTGDAGADTLKGKAGADRFVFKDLNHSTAADPDLIRDFDRSEGDRIGLSAIDAVQGRGDDSFRFVGTGDFRHAGDLRYERRLDQTVISGDVDGDGLADFRIVLDGDMKLRADDFIL